MAVTLEVNDIHKREAIKEKMGFDVSKAIELNKEIEDNSAQVDTKARRAVTPSTIPPANIPEAPTRRYTIKQN